MQAKELLAQWPVSAWQHRRVLVGVSGGADSVALICALRELVEPERLLAAHYNHRWRGAASDGDEAFVVHLCQQLDVECIVEHAPATSPRDDQPARNASDQNDTGAGVNSAMLAKGLALDSESDFGVSKSEEAARDARYQFFIQAAYEHGASYVATAHTADDRVETLLHNLFRGSGLAGAASLKMMRELDQDLVLVRPLIAKFRKDVLQYLQLSGQGYRTDASNSSNDYARNYIRNAVLPAVRVRYRGADANLITFSELVEEALGDIRRLAERWLAEVETDWNELLNQPAHASNLAIVAWRANGFWGAPLSAAAELPWTVLREALRLLWLERGWPLGGMSRRHWESLRELILSAAQSPTAELAFGQRQMLAVLPSALVVETAGGYLAIGRS